MTIVDETNTSENSDATKFLDRSSRLKHFVEGLDIAQDYPLLKTASICRKQFEQLLQTTRFFLIDTLQQYHKKTFDINADILTDYREELLSLPNITPNGLFLPKLPTNISFNAVHLAVANIIDSMKIESKVERIHLPISLRLVNGDTNPGTDARPRASTKPHLDIWAGEPSHAYMIFIPLLGDTENLGIRFFEPRELPSKWLKPLNDYAEGQHLVKDALPYDAHFRSGEIYFVDPFLLHQTMKQSSGLRLSIEFRVLPKMRVKSDLPPPQDRMQNYQQFDYWRAIGRSKVFVSDAPLEQYRAKDLVKNEYAADFRVVELSTDQISHLTAEDIAKMLDIPKEEVDLYSCPESWPPFTYQILQNEDHDHCLKRVFDVLQQDDLRACNDLSQGVWEKGWGEILDKIKKHGLKSEYLTPQYIYHDILRLNGHYVSVTNKHFEHDLYSVLKQIIFRKYFDNVSNLVEFGSGTGATLLLLSQLFPDNTFTGCDWSHASVDIANIIAKETGAKIQGKHFNLFTLEGKDQIDINGDTGVLTLHTLEQLGDAFEPFVTWLLQQSPRICIHIEPIIEFYDASIVFDELALRYHNKRNYLNGFYTHLKQLESDGKVLIHKAKRLSFGSLFQEAYSLIIWSPINS